MEKQMQASQWNEGASCAEPIEGGRSLYGQIQKSVVHMENEIYQLQEELEGKKTQLTLMQENIKRQKQNILELQMAVEDFRVKIRSEALHRHSRLAKLSRVGQMSEVLQECMLENMANRLDRVLIAKESVAKFHDELKNSIKEIETKIEEKQMKFATYIDELVHKYQETENDKLRQKEEHERCVSEYEEKIDTLHKNLSELEAEFNKITTDKHILGAVTNHKSIQLEETLAEEATLESYFKNEEAETNAKEQELQCICGELSTELVAKKEQIIKQEEDIRRQTEELWRQEEDAKALEGSFKEQIILMEESLQNLDRLTKEVKEKETDVIILEGELEKLVDVDDEHLTLTTELISYNGSIQCLTKENNDLINGTEDCQTEFNKLSETNELLKVNQINTEQLNSTLKSNIQKLSLDNENISRNCQLLQDEGDKTLMTLKNTEENLDHEDKTLKNEIEICNNKISSQTSVVGKLREEIMSIDKEWTSERAKILEIEKNINIQKEDHEINLFTFDMMAAKTQKGLEETYNQLKEKDDLIKTINQLEEEMERKEKERSTDLGVLKENHRKQVEAQRERFNQLKIHTSTKLQMSADKIKLTQSELDNITEKIGNLEMNLSDAIKNMYSNKNKLKSYEMLIKNLENKLIHVTRVAQNSQSSINCLYSVPSSISEPKKHYDSDSDSGTSFVIPDDVKISFDRKEQMQNKQPPNFNMQKNNHKPIERKIATSSFKSDPKAELHKSTNNLKRQKIL